MIAQVIIENGVKKIIPLTADAGAGNPVGTIIPMYKKSSPSGYLYCDGSTFDQNAYPLLYAYLGSNVLPDYDTSRQSGEPYSYIKATSGLSENAQDNVINTLNEQRSYSTEEVNTGKKWIDGKPIYRKVIPFDKTLGYTGVHSTVEIGTIPQNGVLTKMDYYGYTATYDIKVYNNNSLNVIVQGQSILASQGFAKSQIQITGFVIIEYTKTTD